MKKVLLIIDVQNDFCENGKLAVKNANLIIPKINNLMNEVFFDQIIATQDWHPKDHISFISNNLTKKVFETIDVDYGKQIIWPDHCIQGTTGAKFHKNLNTNKITAIIRKGYHKNIDSYSAFFENDKKTNTGLDSLISFNCPKKEIDLIIVGIATDVCVFNTAIDAKEILKYDYVTVISDLTAGVSQKEIKNSILQMKNIGIFVDFL